MVKPSLDIALGAPDIQAFKAKMNEASSHVGTVARQMSKQLLDVNTVIKDTLLASASRMALGVVGKIALVVGSFKLMSDAIGGARDQLRDMVDLANRSQNLGVAPAFFQKWNAEARNLQITADDLGAALEHAFNATKEKSPIDPSQWEVAGERITDVEKTLRVLNATVADGKLAGLVLFRDATTQEEKIQAVLKAMIQLDQIGQHLASLDLGERMFGSAFVDKIRQGRTSAESMLSTIQKASGDADGIFPDALVRRAKEMDDQLKVAHQRLSTALKPSWDDLAGVLLTIKGYWSDTIDLIAKAVELSNKIKIPGIPDDSLQGKRDALVAINKRLAGEDSGGILNSAVDGLGRLITGDMPTRVRQELELRRYELQGQIANEEGNFFGPDLPKSKTRGTGTAPTLKPTGSDTDRLQTSIDSIEKRTAALQAEAAAVDQGTVARERSKIAAQLETVAMQANAAAGKGSNVVTEEQRQHINEVADAYAKAAEAMQKAKLASEIKRGSQTALLDPEDAAIAERLKDIYPDVATALGSVEAQAMRTNDAMKSIGSTMSSTLTSGLADILDGTKSVSAGFADMSKVIVRALEEAMIKMLIVQPIMRGLTGMFGFSAGGAVSLPMPGDASFIGPVLKAEGGIIQGPGTGTSDSIPAMLSNGEYVVKASAVAMHRPLLDAINFGRIPRFADGGLVAAPSAPAASMIGGNAITISPQIAVTVQGNPGASPEEHRAMGEQIARQIGPYIQQLAAQEIRTQLRPGGILRRW